MIEPRSKMTNRPIEIDLTGPEGNAFVLMGKVQSWCKQAGIDHEPVIADMMSGDYDHLLSVIERYFPSVIMYR